MPAPRPVRREMGGPPTVYDVARAAGVSIATVSRVLRKPDKVLPATRERVLEAVGALGYVPSAAARGLADRRTGVVGLLLPGREPEDEGDDEPVPQETAAAAVVDDRLLPGRRQSLPVHYYLDEVVRGAEDEAGVLGLGLLVSSGRPDEVERVLRDLVGRVDGLVVVSSTAPVDLLERVAGRIPVTLVAGDREEDRFDRVVAANREGMLALAEQVLAAHRPERVLYLAGADGPDEHVRAAAFAEAVARTVPAPVVERHAGEFREEAARRLGTALADRLAAGEEVPRLVVCASDQMALGLLDVLEARHVAVPGTIAVTGFDGIPAGGFSSPRLTTVAQPMSGLGRLGVRTVAERLADPRAPVREVVLPVEVLLRESCPPTP